MRESGKSINSICRKLGTQYTSLILWLSLYKSGGEAALSDAVPVPQKSVEEKISIVEDILNDSLTLNGAVVKYMLSKTCLKNWIKAYKEEGPSGLENHLVFFIVRSGNPWSRSTCAENHCRQQPFSIFKCKCL